MRSGHRYVCCRSGRNGKIGWSKDGFTGDTPTSTDILGPFYRPGAPIRTTIVPRAYSGQLIHLAGTIYGEDGRTPLENALVEIWQCGEDKLYDNITSEFRFRGAQETGADGEYRFTAMHPIPYPANETVWRPAHIHLLISHADHRGLITQLYLKGDPYLETDPSASSTLAVNRILAISENSRQETMLKFDVVMSNEVKPEAGLYERLAGTYSMSDKSLIEFYPKDDLFFLKWNGQIREGVSYRGNYEFSGGVDNRTTAKFELLDNDRVNIKLHYFAVAPKHEINLVGFKAFRYNQ
ncbi:MAG: hypothetical protein GIW97_00050 [Candidatus Eremiobacteraeota bacterium]|nr:hypothetical protein [Candidatus Eremiobacteraeota bacterium]